MKRPLAALLLLSILAAGCVALGPAAAPDLSPLPTATAAPQPFQLALVHSNDTWGYLFACG